MAQKYIKSIKIVFISGNLLLLSKIIAESDFQMK